MTYYGNGGHRYSGVGRGNLRISLSSRGGSRGVSAEIQNELSEPASSLSLSDFPPIETNTSARSLSPSLAEESPSTSLFKQGGYGSDSIKVYVKDPHKYTGMGRGGFKARPGARSTLQRQQAIAMAIDAEESGGFVSDDINAAESAPTSRRGSQTANQRSLETGPQPSPMRGFQTANQRSVETGPQLSQSANQQSLETEPQPSTRGRGGSQTVNQQSLETGSQPSTRGRGGSQTDNQHSFQNGSQHLAEDADGYFFG